MISGVNNDGDDTMRFILYDSDISKDYGENTTILAWIHSHVETNQCDFLSSVDVHNQRVLEKSFPHIQAIVVELLHTERINHEFYILTTLGKIFCNKPGFHNECQNENYYKQNILSLLIFAYLLKLRMYYIKCVSPYPRIGPFRLIYMS